MEDGEEGTVQPCELGHGEAAEGSGMGYRVGAHFVLRVGKAPIVNLVRSRAVVREWN